MRAPDGVNVAVLLAASYDIEPGIELPDESVIVKVIEVLSMALENVAVGVTLVATLEASELGVCPVTDGGTDALPLNSTST